MGLGFFYLFTPPDTLTETQLFIWMLSFASLTRFAMTFYQVPSTAMVAEMSDDYDERTWLSAIRVLAGWLGGLIFATVSYLVFSEPLRFSVTAALTLPPIMSSPSRGYWHRIGNPRFQHWDPPPDPKTQRAWRAERLLIKSDPRLRQRDRQPAVHGAHRSHIYRGNHYRVH